MPSRLQDRSDVDGSVASYWHGDAHLFPSAVVYFWVVPCVANFLEDGSFTCIRSSDNEDSKANDFLPYR